MMRFPFGRKSRPPAPPAPGGPQVVAPASPRHLLYESDPVFNGIYDAGLVATQTPDPPKPAYSKRRERFYNLAQLFLQAQPLTGAIAECGCWKGLSSYMLCHYLRRAHPEFQGEGYHIFDSFAGLSEPAREDLLSSGTAGASATSPAGTFASTQDAVQAGLHEFSAIEYHPGWLPESLGPLPERSYRFVHVDVDLYEPSKGSLEYFYPRLVPGGLLVSDDYGSLHWPGAKKAVDEFCAAYGAPLLTVSTGQAIIWKR